MELLSLPEPAARIWKRAGGALQKALTQTGNPPLRWSIGGGTILARRWQHRESMDIDLTAPAGTGIDRLNERVGGTLKADMTAVGAQQISTGRTRHQVAFDHGSIDIAELDTRPATGATVAVVDGYQVNVKSTTQILRGKFERALRDESPARDLFDVAVAHHADREALACAANMLSEDEVRQIKAHWQINAHRLEREAKQTLANINPEYEPERRQLVDRATGRLEDARYQAVRIQATQAGVTIETRTAGRGPQTIAVEHDDIAATLNRTGMDEFLDRHCAGGRKEMVNKASAARAGHSEATTILEWTRPTTVGIGDQARDLRRQQEPERALLRTPTALEGRQNRAAARGTASAWGISNDR